MSMFFCEYHNRLEDSDWVGYVTDEDGSEYCEEAMEEYEAELEESVAFNYAEED